MKYGVDVVSPRVAIRSIERISNTGVIKRSLHYLRVLG